MNLLILITSTYFVDTLEFCRQVTSCTFKRTLKKLSLVRVDPSKVVSEVNTLYKVASSSICLNAAHDLSVNPTPPSTSMSSNQCFTFFKYVLHSRGGLKVSQINNTVTGRALYCCCVVQNRFMTV